MDECSSELSAYQDQLNFAIEMCTLMFEAFDLWMDAIAAVAEDCADGLGPRPEIPEPPPGTGFVDPMDVHEIEAQQEQWDQNLQDCIESNSEVIDAQNTYLDLQAACDIETAAADALHQAYEACIHRLEFGIPFA